MKLIPKKLCCIDTAKELHIVLDEDKEIEIDEEKVMETYSSIERPEEEEGEKEVEVAEMEGDYSSQDSEECSASPGAL